MMFKREGKMYETPLEMSELMNGTFKPVFTKETNFMTPKVTQQQESLKHTNKETRNQEAAGRAGC